MSSEKIEVKGQNNRETGVFNPSLLTSDASQFGGGGKRIRTADHLVANQALSQLSYTPLKNKFQIPIFKSQTPPLEFGIWNLYFAFMVGLGRFELPTSRLSGVRSNHLSYRPVRLLLAYSPNPVSTYRGRSAAAISLLLLSKLNSQSCRGIDHGIGRAKARPSIP